MLSRIPYLPLFLTICLAILACLLGGCQRRDPEMERRHHELHVILRTFTKLDRISQYMEGSKTAGPDLKYWSGDFPPEERIVILGRERPVVPEAFRSELGPFFEACHSLPWDGPTMREPDFYEEFWPEGRYLYRQNKKATKAMRPEFLYGYLSSGTWFLLISCGPDREWDTVWTDNFHERYGTLAPEEVHKTFAKHMYDPTNGLQSRGDILAGSRNAMIPNHSPHLERLFFDGLERLRDE